MQTTTKIDTQTHATLKALSRQTGLSMVEILAKAVDSFRREQLVAGLNEDYKVLRSDPEAWNAVVAERELWDSTLADGLDEENAATRGDLGDRT